MSTMVSTVLHIEREAEAQLSNARATAETILADAKSERENAARTSADAIRAEIAELERKADDARAQKAAQANAAGQTALDKVRNVSPAAYDRAVQSMVGALGRGK